MNESTLKYYIKKATFSKGHIRSEGGVAIPYSSFKLSFNIESNPLFVDAFRLSQL